MGRTGMLVHAHGSHHLESTTKKRHRVSLVAQPVRVHQHTRAARAPLLPAPLPPTLFPQPLGSQLGLRVPKQAAKTRLNSSRAWAACTGRGAATGFD